MENFSSISGNLYSKGSVFERPLERGVIVGEKVFSLNLLAWHGLCIIMGYVSETNTEGLINENHNN